MALLLTLHWPEQVMWSYHGLSFLCPEGEGSWTLMNTCNVSHMVKIDLELVKLLNLAEHLCAEGKMILLLAYFTRLF